MKNASIKGIAKFVTCGKIMLVGVVCLGWHPAGAAEIRNTEADMDFMTSSLNPPSINQICYEAAMAEPFAPEACLSHLNTADSNLLVNQRLHALMAIGYARTGDPATAARHLAIASQALGDWQSLANIGITQLYLGEYRAAAASLQQALNNATDVEPSLHLNYALALRALGDFEGSAQQYGMYQNTLTEGF